MIGRKPSTRMTAIRWSPYASEESLRRGPVEVESVDQSLLEAAPLTKGDGKWQAGARCWRAPGSRFWGHFAIRETPVSETLIARGVAVGERAPPASGYLAKVRVARACLIEDGG